MNYLREKLERCKLIIALAEGVFLLGELGILRNLEVAGPKAYLEHLYNYEVLNVHPSGLVKNDGVWCASGFEVGAEISREFVEWCQH